MMLSPARSATPQGRWTRRRTLVGGVWGGAAAFVAACGGTKGATEASKTVATPTVGSSSAQTATERPEPGGTLNIFQVGNPPTLDPHRTTSFYTENVAGAVLSARNDPFWQRIRSWRRTGGAVPGPFEAWLLVRGMRTLFLRVQRASESALAIAQHFEKHPALSAVLYPGLPSHPGHAIAARQMTGGFGGMLSVRVAGGIEPAKSVLAKVKVFKRATSLGGVESLIEHRSSMEGPSSPVPDDLLRLSVGIESPMDLIADLETALRGNR